jgi:isoaspartyl peptidase/L-asparaginase-like protein (Ntn-hydrolase superfamily)
VAEPALVVHGGAGPLPREPFDPAPVTAALEAALDAGWSRLAGGALDAAQAAVEALEDAPMFNAGRGSVLTSAGSVEMDAAVMHGPDRSAGAVACVSRVRHPVALARATMERTPHVLMSGRGAERLAEELDLELLKPEWFVTARERERLARWQARAAALPAEPGGGTVGAVARDAGGALAAATSTGGVRGQLPGRVGDSPLLGAGTWADETCAISATGAGEALIRAAAAHELAALVRHGGLGLAEAADAVLREHVEPLGGAAGLIAIAADGPPVLPFTTPAMYRGWRVGGDPPRTAIGAG